MKKVIFYLWLLINPFLVRAICRRFTRYWQFWISSLLLSIATAIALPILVFKVDFPNWLPFAFIAWQAMILGIAERKYEKPEEKVETGVKAEKKGKVGMGRADDFFARKILPWKERGIRKKLSGLIEKDEKLIIVGSATYRNIKKVLLFRRCLIGITNKRILLFLRKHPLYFRDQKILSFPLEQIKSCQLETYELTGKTHGWSFSTTDGVKHQFSFDKGFYEEYFIPKLDSSLKELLEKR